MNASPFVFVLAALIRCGGASAAVGRCGLDEAISLLARNARTRRVVPTDDNRFKFPFQESALRSPNCAYIDPNLAYGYSQCFIKSVAESYVTVSNWPSATVQVTVATYAPASGPGGFPGGAATISMQLTQTAAIFAPMGISFNFNVINQISQSSYDEFNLNPVTLGPGPSNIENVFAKLNVDFDISARQSAIYVALLPMNIDEFIGLCFPVPQMLEQISRNIPAYVGGICIVDPRFFLNSTTGGHAASTGSTLAHEIAHSLGLLHPHQDVSQVTQTQASPIAFGACSNTGLPAECVALSDVYTTGDFCTDTPPTANPLQFFNNTAIFNKETCTTGPQYPGLCGQVGSLNVSIDIANYMSYFPQHCQNMFTPMQIGRMRCSIDRFLAYNTTLVAPRAPAPVSLVSASFTSTTSATVEWVPPLTLLSTAGASLPVPIGMTYVIRRSPAFASGDVVVSASTYRYIDNTANSSWSYTYRVFARNGNGDGGMSAAATVTPLGTGSSSSSPSLSTGAIIGIAIGGVAVAVIIVIAAVYALHRTPGTAAYRGKVQPSDGTQWPARGSATELGSVTSSQ